MGEPKKYKYWFRVVACFMVHSICRVCVCVWERERERENVREKVTWLPCLTGEIADHEPHRRDLINAALLFFSPEPTVYNVRWNLIQVLEALSVGLYLFVCFFHILICVVTLHTSCNIKFSTIHEDNHLSCQIYSQSPKSEFCKC